MTSLKKKERITSGSAFCFNGEGNQVPYRYDIKETIDIDFDRNAVKEIVNALQMESDEMSNHADYCLTSVEVQFEPRLSINDTFEEQVEKFASAQ